MNAHLARTLTDVLADRQLLTHPFYQRWEAGKVSREELTRYAEQYRHFEAMFPRFLESLRDELPEGVARDGVKKNLDDEVATPSHLELFEKFASFYDADNVEMSPAMSGMLGAYAQVLENGIVSSLAGLWAYESQGAAIADSKADGLQMFYGADNDATEFWRVHGSLEDDHATWTFEALDSLNPDLALVKEGVLTIGDAWWAFLDERELLASALQ
jgi:pyrroloquinoline-quinone synthase